MKAIQDHPFWIALALMFTIDFARAEVFRGGKIYELNSQRKLLLFTLFADLKSIGPDQKVFVSRYVDPAGNEAMTEEASFVRLNLQKYVVRQNQLNETYELDVDRGKLRFSVTKKGETERKEMDLPSNLIVGPAFVPFLQQHWHEIQNQETVIAQLAVLDRMSTYSFEFVKLRDEKIDGSDAVIVRMKPSSTLISSVVRPVYLVVSADGSRILELKGRMLTKRRVGGRWVDLEAEAVFAY